MINSLRRQSVAAILMAFILPAVAWLSSGCATVKEGNNPVVVRAQQTLSVAEATVDGFLKAEHANRAFYRAHAPWVHSAAESLRKRRTQAFQTALDALSAYKAGGSQDRLNAALAAVLVLVAEAERAVAEMRKL